MQGTHETRVVSRYTHEAILYIDITDITDGRSINVSDNGSI